MGKIFVNKRIELANTLPSEFYTNEKFYNLTKEKIFLKSWQWIDNKGINKKDKIIIPINILEELIKENNLTNFTQEDVKYIAYETVHNLKCWEDFPATLPKLKKKVIMLRNLKIAFQK